MSLRVRRGTQLTSPKETRDYLALKLGTLECEVFAVIFLDKRHRLISYQEMFYLSRALKNVSSFFSDSLTNPSSNNCATNPSRSAAERS
jgi:hypothetical protein